MLKNIARTLSGMLLLATVGLAQAEPSCSDLSTLIDRRDDGHFEVWVQISETLPGSPGWLIVGLEPGPTTISLPNFELTLGVQNIIAAPFLGRADENGSLGQRFLVPSIIAAMGLDLQGLNIDLARTENGPEIKPCLSNVIALLD